MVPVDVDERRLAVDRRRDNVAVLLEHRLGKTHIAFDIIDDQHAAGLAASWQRYVCGTPRIQGTGQPDLSD